MFRVRKKWKNIYLLVNLKCECYLLANVCFQNTEDATLVHTSLFLQKIKEDTCQKTAAIPAGMLQCALTNLEHRNQLYINARTTTFSTL